MAAHDYMIGWDIGGAHVKAAQVDERGAVLKVWQAPCPLWKGIEQLQAPVLTILQNLPPTCRHALTMTGELVDCFAGRQQGVFAILQAMRQLLNTVEIQVFAGRLGLLPLTHVDSSHSMDIASANWLASAHLAAAKVGHGLFVDIGSTTTDILMLTDRQPKVNGYSDYERLASGELLYTGVVRTAVMAVAQQAEFNGRSMGLMMEYFATMADVYRICGDLQLWHDQSETADGADKSLAASARRLSRMTGYEFSENDWPIWQDFALWLKRQQHDLILQHCRRHRPCLDACDRGFLVGAGVGSFLLPDIAVDLELDYIPFTDLFQFSNRHGALTAGDCAPAVAVAWLAGGFG